MDIRFTTAKLTATVTMIAFGLAACDTTPPKPASTGSAVTAPIGDAEKALRKQAIAMQRTILEAALAGVAVGGGLGFAFGDKEDAKRGINIGLFTGLTAGTYVAFVQRKYFGKERRLRAIKSDLDKNAAQMRTTINVMRDVLAVQRSELAAVKARFASGGATSADIQAEIVQARANLGEMQKVIDGATVRQSEFGETRGLTLVSGGGSRIDDDLAALSQQIAAMKAIASELASEI